MKKKKQESPRDRMKKIPLWQWGLIVIVAGLLGNQVTSFLPVPVDSAAARGQAFGRGLVAVLAVIAGIVLIVMHFVRRKRR